MNHRRTPILLVIAVAATGLGLAACHQKQPSPGQEMKQGIGQMGVGAVKAASQAGQVIADSAITSKIKIQLATNEGLSGYKIHVKTKNGMVTLSGTVDSNSERKLAGQIAHGTGGVKGVINDINVAPQD